MNRRYRRQGITEIAIRGALDLIARAGGGRRLYERLGFTYVRPKGLKNCVMSLELPTKP